ANPEKLFVRSRIIDMPNRVDDHPAVLVLCFDQSVDRHAVPTRKDHDETRLDPKLAQQRRYQPRLVAAVPAALQHLDRGRSENWQNKEPVVRVEALVIVDPIVDRPDPRRVASEPGGDGERSSLENRTVANPARPNRDRQSKRDNGQHRAGSSKT